MKSGGTKKSKRKNESKDHEKAEIVKINIIKLKHITSKTSNLFKKINEKPYQQT